MVNLALCTAACDARAKPCRPALLFGSACRAGSLCSIVYTVLTYVIIFIVWFWMSFVAFESRYYYYSAHQRSDEAACCLYSGPSVCLCVCLFSLPVHTKTENYWPEIDILWYKYVLGWILHFGDICHIWAWPLNLTTIFVLLDKKIDCKLKTTGYILL